MITRRQERRNFFMTDRSKILLCSKSTCLDWRQATLFLFLSFVVWNQKFESVCFFLCVRVKSNFCWLRIDKISILLFLLRLSKKLGTHGANSNKLTMTRKPNNSDKVSEKFFLCCCFVGFIRCCWLPNKKKIGFG